MPKGRVFKVASADVLDVARMRGKSRSLREGMAHGRLACLTQMLKFCYWKERKKGTSGSGVSQLTWLISMIYWYTPVRCG